MEYPALDRLEQLASSLDALQHRMGRQLDELRRQPVEVSSDGGAVRVTVDHGGRVERVEIGARGMRYDAAQLGAEITDTIRRAQARAADRLRDSMRDVLGADAPNYPLD